MSKWTFIISFTLVLTSCADLKKSEQLERIHALENELSAMESTLNSLDTVAWQTQMEEVNAMMDQLKQLESDTISLDEALHIDAFKENRGKMGGILAVHQRCSKEIGASEKRLKKLRSDIETGNGRRHKYNEYLDYEEQQMKLLLADFALYEKTLKTYNESMPEALEKVETIIVERIQQEEVQ